MVVGIVARRLLWAGRRETMIALGEAVAEA